MDDRIVRQMSELCHDRLSTAPSRGRISVAAVRPPWDAPRGRAKAAGIRNKSELAPRPILAAVVARIHASPGAGDPPSRGVHAEPHTTRLKRPPPPSDQSHAVPTGSFGRLANNPLTSSGSTWTLTLVLRRTLREAVLELQGADGSLKQNRNSAAPSGR